MTNVLQVFVQPVRHKWGFHKKFTCIRLNLEEMDMTKQDAPHCQTMGVVRELPPSDLQSGLGVRLLLSRDLADAVPVLKKEHVPGSRFGEINPTSCRVEHGNEDSSGNRQPSGQTKKYHSEETNPILPSLPSPQPKKMSSHS